MEDRDAAVAADDVSEAFAVLSDETRLSVIRVLGDAGGTGTYQAVPFSTLQERVGVDDNGRFTYHLDKLVGRFVERTDEGYRLRIPGIQVYQAIQSGALAEHDPVGPLDTDVDCFCGGGPLQVGYEEFRFSLDCPDCDRTGVSYPIDPESFGADLPDDILRAADRRLKRDTFSMDLGFCPYCAGPVETEFRGQRPEFDHPEEDGSLVASRRACTRCHWFINFRTYVVALIKPAVAGTFSKDGVVTFEVPQWSNRYRWVESLRSEAPIRVELEMRIDDVQRTVVFDSDLDVVAIEGEPG